MSINTTIGGATANSYVSVASADEYFLTKDGNVNWTDMGSTGTLSSTARKENILKQSTRELDRTYRFQESKYNTDTKGGDNYQNLEFPRSSTIDSDGDVMIPDEVKFATYEQAGWILERVVTRYNTEGVLVKAAFIGAEAYTYIGGWVNRQVAGSGRYSWQSGKV